MNTQAQLEDLVAHYVEGTCGPTELAALEALLLEDAGNRKYFLDIVLLAEDLRMLSNPRQHRIDVGVLPVEFQLQRQRMRTVTTALLAAAAVILLSVVPMWTQMAPRHKSESSEAPGYLGLDNVRVTAVATWDHSASASR